MNYATVVGRHSVAARIVRATLGECQLKPWVARRGGHGVPPLKSGSIDLATLRRSSRAASYDTRTAPRLTRP